jgi:p21-activated kinase 2
MMMEEETKNEASFMNSPLDLSHAQDDFFYKIS